MAPVATKELGMMPVIRLNDTTFANLSVLKVWSAAKTPGDAIDWLIKDKMEQLGLEQDDEPEDNVNITNDGAIEFTSAPSMSFTKPLMAKLDGQLVSNPRWSTILISAISSVMAKGFEGKALVAELEVPAKADRYEEDGFKFYPDLGISIQGQSASDAWKEIERLAKAHNIRVKVEFWWRRNPKAQFPGKTGILTVGKA